MVADGCVIEMMIARGFSATVGYLPHFEATARFTVYPTLPDVTHHLARFQDRSAGLKWQFARDRNWSFALGTYLPVDRIGQGVPAITTAPAVVAVHGEVPREEGGQFRLGAGRTAVHGAVYQDQGWTAASLVVGDLRAVG